MPPHPPLRNRRSSLDILLRDEEEVEDEAVDPQGSPATETGGYYEFDAGGESDLPYYEDDGASAAGGGPSAAEAKASDAAAQLQRSIMPSGVISTYAHQPVMDERLGRKRTAAQHRELRRRPPRRRRRRRWRRGRRTRT